MAPTTLNAKAYTVAWISALAIERSAALAQLDEEHGKPEGFEQNRMDHNSYHWGRMGEHNVVITSLPSTRNGTTPAAITVANLLASLHQIRFGLLVGIGGGIPRLPDRDIRLGDIVVGQPTRTTGGVVQYDKGAILPDGKWERRSVLNSPPTVLLSALSAMQAKHAESKSLVPELLAEMERKHPDLQESGYTHQGPEHDQLYSASSPLTGGGSDLRSTCTRNVVVQRPSRPNLDPVVHYGLIASGNTLFKGPMNRELMEAIAADQEAQNNNEEVLCVEMEAAGVVNDLPCLVIRGISDYADSYKTDKWQKYASATAAAFAKELLGYVHAWRLESTKPAVDVMNLSQ